MNIYPPKVFIITSFFYEGLGQHMSPVKYRTILKYRLMISLFPVDAICPVCRKTCLDSFGEYAVHCKELTGFKYRRDMVRDVLFDICRRAGISAKKEPPVNFLTDRSDGISTLRPTDVLVFGWVGGKHACVKLLNRVQRVMNSNVMTPKFINVVFHRISFAIQKRLMAQLVARLSSTTM
ncbi:hypothetical protein Tco_1423997 [Tanacetum coccineum]